MLQNRKSFLLALLAYLGYLLTWGLAQAWANSQSESAAFWSLLFFMVIHVGLFGIAIPFHLIRCFGYKLQDSASRRGFAIGLAVLTLVFVAGVFLSGSLTVLTADPPAIASIGKYVLIFAPMALGICLQCFVLIPQAVKNAVGSSSLASIAMILIAALSVGIGFWVDQLFSNAEDALTMAILGVLVALGIQQTRSLTLTYLFFLPVMLVNTLAEGKYYDSPWGALLIGFGICAMAFIYFRRSGAVSA